MDGKGNYPKAFETKVATKLGNCCYRIWPHLILRLDLQFCQAECTHHTIHMKNSDYFYISVCTNENVLSEKAVKLTTKQQLLQNKNLTEIKANYLQHECHMMKIF